MCSPAGDLWVFHKALDADDCLAGSEGHGFSDNIFFRAIQYPHPVQSLQERENMHFG